VSVKAHIPVKDFVVIEWVADLIPEAVWTIYRRDASLAAVENRTAILGCSSSEFIDLSIFLDFKLSHCSVCPV
jgi:hypothetical protein